MNLFNMIFNVISASKVNDGNISELFFKPEGFLEYLPNMGIGMLVIFVIIGIIILATILINKIFSPKKEDK